MSDVSFAQIGRRSIQVYPKANWSTPVPLGNRKSGPEVQRQHLDLYTNNTHLKIGLAMSVECLIQRRINKCKVNQSKVNTCIT